MASIMMRSMAVVAMAAAGAGAQPDSRKPLLERTEPHDWVLTCNVNVRSYGRSDVHTNMPTRAALDFTSAAVVFPMIENTASSVTKQPPELGGKLLLNDRVSDANPTFLTGDYPCGTRLGKWVMHEWSGEEVGLQVTIPATCYQTKFDEDAANQVGWPEAWPAVAQSTFKPQFFVDTMPGKDGAEAASDMEQVKKMVSQWMGGKDPKSLPPTKLAKFLAGKVLEAVQVSGDGQNYARTGEIEGFNLIGAAETAKRGRGSEFDEVCLLAAVYRQAGLPCRTVIGWDVGEAKRDKDKKFLARNNGTKGLRGWVEFALPDVNSPGGLAWIPVDVVRMRKSSSRMQPLERPWKYFGTHDELDGVIPIAFQFHPPTTVVAHGSPALWGWMVTPKPPDNVTQAIRFDAVTESKNTEQQQKDRDDKKKDKKHGHY